MGKYKYLLKKKGKFKKNKYRNTIIKNDVLSFNNPSSFL